jgi:hypothetical protein
VDLEIGVAVTAVPCPLPSDQEHAAGPESVLVLPLREDASGNGIYPEESGSLVKQLRAAGMDAAYQHRPEQRLFEGRKGFIPDAVYTVILGVLSSAAWDGVKRLIGSKPRRRLKVTFGQVDGPDAGSARWWQVEGDSSDVIAAIDKLMTVGAMAGEAVERSTAPDGPAISGGQADSSDPTSASQRGAGWSAVPDGPDIDIHEAAVRKRREDYLAEALSLRDQAKALLATDHDAAEKCARASLDRVVRAFWWSEELPEEEPIHELMHDLGRWVRQTFGCTIIPKDGAYMETCPVSIAHRRMGMSIGFTAQRLCSLCGEDISECLHMPGTAYLVPGGIGPSGCCPVCLSETCTEHDSAHTYRVSPVAMIMDMDLQEISLVPRPSQPEARLTAISMSSDDLREYLGPGFVVGMPLSCNKCLSGCWGFTTLEPPAATLSDDPSGPAH